MPLLILGIDPGTRITGYGLITDEPRPTLHDHGLIKPPSGLPLEHRLHRIHQSLLELADRHRPGLVAVEDTFIGKSAKSSMALGQAQALVLITAASHDIPLRRFPPSLVKRLTTGAGAASKQQVRAAVQMILQAPPDISTDAADALAVAFSAALAGDEQRALARV